MSALGNGDRVRAMLLSVRRSQPARSKASTQASAVALSSELSRSRLWPVAGETMPNAQKRSLRNPSHSTTQLCGVEFALGCHSARLSPTNLEVLHTADAFGALLARLIPDATAAPCAYQEAVLHLSAHQTSQIMLFQTALCR